MASQVESGELCLVVSSNFFVQLKDTGDPEMKRMKTPSTLTTLDIATETAGPNRIEVEQFDSFGPMGVESLGNGRNTRLKSIKFLGPPGC